MKESKEILIEMMDILSYDPETGFLTWKRKPAGNTQAGRAGGVSSEGYRRISFKDKRYLEHRLAWLFFYKEPPPGDIDHINGEKDDNRISNLRILSRRLNCINKAKHLAGKLSGGYFSKERKKWRCTFRVGRKIVNAGQFETEEEMHISYGLSVHLLQLDL